MPAAQLTPTPASKAESPNSMTLNGRWLLRSDPAKQGLDEQWWLSFKWWDNHESLEVPGPFQRVLGADYHGVAWLAKVVRVPAAWWETRAKGERLWIRFDAVATDATVWVNGIDVGRHIGDFAPFQFDVTDAVQQGWAKKAPMNPPFEGEITICVRVDEIPATRPPPGVTTENGHITKGFHDVLSIQHGGIWEGVSLRRTGPSALIPNGVRIIADQESGQVNILAERFPCGTPAALVATIRGPGGEVVAESACEVAAACERASITQTIASPQPWTPETPTLYSLTIELRDNGTSTDQCAIRFGFRTVTTGGPDNRHILLNGKPILIRGVLHWGHEPEHMSPAPPPDQVRAEFVRLKEMGFNCVCLCMWYPPPYYFDIADEMGMLLWQEHPIWKGAMEEELIPEYQRMLEQFFRRDRNHPSVVIVSGSCEHERIHPDLAAWWWKRAKEELPDRIVQVQTAFIAWVNPDHVDAHDEHVYESSGRWVKFCEDLQATLKELPPKPFLMGETIIGTSWVDAAAIRAHLQTHPASKAEIRGGSPWWLPKGLAECEAFERTIAERYGRQTLTRFQQGADLSNLGMRKFQSEVLRMFPGSAGWVMNQIRDVPAGRLGFMDDLGRWRFTPEQTRPWLSETIALLRTPDQRRGFTGGRDIDAEIGVSNYGSEPFEGAIQVRVGVTGHEIDVDAPVKAGMADVSFARVKLPLPAVERPTRINIRAVAPGLPPNGWDLWAFPQVDDVPPDVVRLDGLTFSRKDLESEFEERCYSSGWGMKARTWKSVMPHPETVLFKAPLWRFDGPMPPGTRIVVTHKLTASVVDFLIGGGRVLLLASRTPGGLGTKFLNVWGQVPLIIEEGPLVSGDADWIADLLHHDLTRRYTRAIPSEELGIADQVDPLVRLVFTHDRGAPKMLDSAFMARVGSGVLLATCLDHTEDPGRYLLQRFLEWLAAEEPTCRRELDPARVQSWIFEQAPK